jgi:carboxymethylenebutenolidase
MEASLMLEQKVKFADSQLESLLPEVSFNRRGFLASSASMGFALSAGPVAAQSVIRTPADGLDAGDIKVTVAGGQMPGYMAAPAKAGKYAAVLVIPEIFGMHEYQKDICRRLAKLGYVGVSIDPFFRIGDLSKLTEIREVLAGANKLEDTQMLADLDSVVEFMEKQPKINAKKMGITGMCRGGRTVWMYVGHSKIMKAGVSWYGGLNPTPPAMPRTPLDVAATLNAPVLGLYAGADSGIPVAAVAKMQEALKTGNRNSKASQFILYPEVPHAFHADYRPSYRKEAADAAWAQMLAWFKANGVA